VSSTVVDDNGVVLIHYLPDVNFLVKGLDLCQGLEGLSTKTQILIKPHGEIQIKAKSQFDSKDFFERGK
jgi:hypothetical protein